MRRSLLIFATAVALLGALFGVPGTTAQPTPSGETIYDSTVTPLPGNQSSHAFEATSTSEVGDKVTFAGTGRTLTDVTVTMSSWGCQTGHWSTGDCITTFGATFEVPITLKLYAAGEGDTIGPVIDQVTQTFAIPYRPSSDPDNCTGGNAGKWYDGTTCFNGKATNITFDFSARNTVVPDTVIYGIAYNTTHHGYTPMGTTPCSATPAGCGYDSLNVALSPSAVVGTDVDANGAYLNSSWAGAYCPGPVGVGAFRADTGCWAGLVPAVRFGAERPTAQIGDCKNGGWRQLTDETLTPFKNQGDCVSYVVTHGRNAASG